MGGTTRSLNVSYLRAVPIGTTVIFRSHVVQIGKTMAMIRATMESEDGKVVFATCEHHKVNVPALPAHMAISTGLEEPEVAKSSVKPGARL